MSCFPLSSGQTVTAHRWAFSSSISHCHHVSLKLKTHVRRKEAITLEQVHTGRSPSLNSVQLCEGAGRVSHLNSSSDRAETGSHHHQSLQAGSSFDMLGFIFRSSTASLLSVFLGTKSKKSHQAAVLDSSLTGLHEGYMMVWFWPFLVLFCFISWQCLTCHLPVTPSL